MFRLEGRPRVERAIEWTSRHRVAGPFLWGLGAVAAVLLPIPVVIGLHRVADIGGPIRILVTLAAIIVALLPYVALVTTVVPGYIVGRSRGSGWLAAAGLVAPLAVPVAWTTIVLFARYGGSAAVTPFVLPLFFVPFWLGLRRGRATWRRLSAMPAATS